MKINLKSRLLSDCGPIKTKFSLVSHSNSNLPLCRSFQLLFIDVLCDIQLTYCINISINYIPTQVHAMYYIRKSVNAMSFKPFMFFIIFYFLVILEITVVFKYICYL